MNRFNKIFHHIKSKKIDEKIEYLNKELKKTGIVLEAGPTMTTGSLYQLHTFVPAVPEETADVPDSTGFIAGTSTQDANGGNVSDSNTWNNGWNNVSDMQNSNDIGGETDRNIPFTPDLSGWDGSSTSANDSVIFGGERAEGMTQPTSATGIAVYSGDQGQRCIGSLGAGNKFVQILVGDAVFGSYTYPSEPKGGYYSSYSDNEFTAARNLAAAYEDNKNKGSVTRKAWVPFQTANNGASYADYTGAKKTTTRYTSSTPDGAPVYWALKDVNILTGQRTTYVTQDYVPSYTLLTQNSLDDPSYYPGNPNNFMDFLRGALDVGQSALDWLLDLLDDDDEIAGGGLSYPRDLDDPFEHHDDIDDDDLLDDSDFDMSDWEFAFAELEDELEKDGYPSSSDPSPFDEPASDAHPGWVNPGDEVAWGRKTPEQLQKERFDYWNNTGKYQKKRQVDTHATMTYEGMGMSPQAFQDKFGMTHNEWLDNRNWLPDGRPNPNGPAWNKYKNEKYEPQGELIKEGWESPKHTYIDKNQQKRWFKEKDVAPVYPKKAPPKMVKGWHPRFVVKLDTPIPVIKVSKKDLERSHTFKPDEIEELIQLIKNLNDYIKRNPDHLAYARVRYPKHDTRLAALNYKLDMQLAAADEYIETRFPENERLFDRLMRRTKESIKLTDPKTYENNNGKLITFNKLARVDDNYQPRKIKVKKKPKMSQGKLFLLPNRKKKDDILKDKMAVLDKEIQKTMPET